MYLSFKLFSFEYFDFEKNGVFFSNFSLLVRNLVRREPLLNLFRDVSA